MLICSRWSSELRFVCAELLSEDEDMESMRNPLQDVTAGLLNSSGQQLPLQAVHVKCKLMDLLSQVEQRQQILVFALMPSF